MVRCRERGDLFPNFFRFDFSAGGTGVNGGYNFAFVRCDGLDEFFRVPIH